IVINVFMFLCLHFYGLLLEYLLIVENLIIKLLVYLFTIFILYVFKLKIKFIKYLYYILTLPILIPYVIFTIGFPFIYLQLQILFYLVVCSVIPLFTLGVYSFLKYPPISLQLKVYLILTCTVFCSVIFQKQFKWIVDTLSPARFKTSNNLKSYNIKELSDYELTENNIKFVVFLIYFIIILLVNFYNFQDLSYYKTEEIDKAVIQSFVTYIAFDRIISSMKKVEFKPSEMIKKMIQSV